MYSKTKLLTSFEAVLVGGGDDSDSRAKRIWVHIGQSMAGSAIVKVKSSWFRVCLPLLLEATFMMWCVEGCGDFTPKASPWTPKLLVEWMGCGTS